MSKAEHSIIDLLNALRDAHTISTTTWDTLGPERALRLASKRIVVDGMSLKEVAASIGLSPYKLRIALDELYGVTWDAKRNERNARHGSVGEIHPKALLSEDAVIYLRSSYNLHLIDLEITTIVNELFDINVSQSTVEDARHGFNWKHLNDLYPPVILGRGTRVTEKRRRKLIEQINTPIAKAASVVARSLRRGKPGTSPKFTEEQVKQIFCDTREGKVIAEELSVSEHTIVRIRTGKFYHYITKNLVAPKRIKNAPNKILTRDKARAIFMDQRTNQEIARAYGVGVHVVKQVRARRSYTIETTDLARNAK